MEKSNELIIKKDKTVFKYKIVVTILIMLFICSLVIGIVVISNKKNKGHIIYDNIPVIKLNGIESNYHNVASEWIKENDDYVYKSYPVTLPNSDVISNITKVDKNENNKIELNLPCSCRISYFDLDDTLEIRWENEGWMVAKSKNIEFEKEDNTICFSDFVIDNNILLVVTCEYQDLHIVYYYVIYK